MVKQLIFIGAPACGKGTQTIMLSQKTSMPHIDTGSLLRKSIADKTPEGVIAKKYIDEGKLVPPEIVADIIKNRLSSDDCKNGCILDGYPRSVIQAQTLDQINKEVFKDKDVDLRVIYFDLDEEILLERIVNRRSCPKCGKIYNLKFAKPKNDNVCDIDGEVLVQRKDDTVETASKRFETYHKETEPLIEYYKEKGVLINLDANGSVEEIFNRLNKVIE